MEAPLQTIWSRGDILSLRDACGYIPMILEARVAVGPADNTTPDGTGRTSVIVWQPAAAGNQLLAHIQSQARELKMRLDAVLLRLTLKGNFIWSDQARALFKKEQPGGFLDGETYRSPGPPGFVAPSGDGRRGGDFELWFWLNLVQTVQPPPKTTDVTPKLTDVPKTTEVAPKLTDVTPKAAEVKTTDVIHKVVEVGKTAEVTKALEHGKVQENVAAPSSGRRTRSTATTSGAAKAAPKKKAFIRKQERPPTGPGPKKKRKS